MKFKIVPKIVNVVATGDTKQPVDIHRLSKFPWCLHDEEIYGGRVSYIKDEKMSGRVTVFPSGKVISVGARSISQASSELKHAVELLVKIKFIKPCKVKPKVRNIVSCIQLPNRVNLENISKHGHTAYEPEQFPGLVYHLDNLESVSILLFSNGKCVIAGAKSMNEVHQAIKSTLSLIKKQDV
jgi:transcription initiation factor TFIID TATA-box-binding protein